MGFADNTRLILRNNRSLMSGIRNRHFKNPIKKTRYTETNQYFIKKDSLLDKNTIDGNSLIQTIKNDYPWIIIILVIFTIVINYLTT